MPDFVTWEDLKEHCKEKQENCGRLTAAKAKGEKAVLESINQKLGAIPLLVDRVATLEGIVGRPGTVVLQRAVLIVIVVLAIGCGFAGRDAVKFLSGLGVTTPPAVVR